MRVSQELQTLGLRLVFIISPQWQWQNVTVALTSRHRLILMFCTLQTGTFGSQWPQAQNKQHKETHPPSEKVYHHCNTITKAQIIRAYWETKANIIQSIKKTKKQPDNNPCCRSSFDRSYRRHFCAWNVLKHKDYIIFIPVTENVNPWLYLYILYIFKSIMNMQIILH